MKILLLADLPLWTLEGLEEYKQEGAYSSWLEALFPYFGKHAELECYWIVFSKHVSSPEVHRVLNQTIHILPRWKKSFAMLTRYYFEIKRVQSTIRSIDPDVIHSWGSEDVYGISGAAINKPKIFTLQGSLTDYLNKLGGGFLFRIQAGMEKGVLSEFSEVTTESQLAKNLALELNPNANVSIVDYGVHPSFYDVEWKPDVKCHFLFVGKIDERKGVRMLVKVFSNSEFSHMHLTIIGDGPLKEELEKMSGKNIKWLGRKDRSFIQAELAKSWSLVMPTNADTGPTVLKEARVVGLPVIITRSAGASDYITDGRNGFVIDSGDEEQLKLSMLKVASRRETCIEYGEYKHAQARIDLHPSKTVEQFKELYKTL